MQVKLVEMTSEEFQNFISFEMEHYADEHIKSGNWKPEEAMDKAKAEFETLLPDGKDTENNHLYTIRNGDKEVGVIWLAQTSAEKGFIYSITIWEENQGKGFGRKAMEELETLARELGIKHLGLHVFAHNTIARDLYEKLGYKEKNIKMEKTL
ncbi:GNAT family N-acetyltransferase [Halobacillus rhizosphaerae]|uniref:GNAT family N-acetyltransferase n=1 Tax=Halobacillus rhizosphaerae TaxID=3064889 RepID=UPI00398AA21C